MWLRTGDATSQRGNGSTERAIPYLSHRITSATYADEGQLMRRLTSMTYIRLTPDISCKDAVRPTVKEVDVAYGSPSSVRHQHP